MSDTARDYQTIDPASTEGLDVLFTDGANEVTREQPGNSLGMASNGQALPLKRVGNASWISVEQAAAQLGISPNAVNYQALEELRDMHDRWKIGMVLIGDPGLERSLDRQPHFVNRVAFVQPFNQLKPGEANKYVRAQADLMGLEPPEEEIHTAIFWYTQGNLRMLEKLFRLIERLVKLNGDTAIKRDVLDTAREMLMYANIRPSEKCS